MKKGGATKCNAPGCKTCNMLNLSSEVNLKNRKVKLMKGSCKSSNTCYLAMCKLCDKPYTGRTVVPLHSRINGHRHYYKDVVKNSLENNLDDIDTSNNLYTLGLHLHLEHDLANPEDFRHIGSG